MNSESQWPLYISIVLAVYAVVILFFVIRGALKTKSIADYGVGNGFPSWIVGLSLAASMTSAATFVINPGFISLYGLAGIISMAIVLPLAAFASLIFFTKGFAKFGKAVKANTMSQWIGNRFNNKYYKFFFAVIALLLITFIVLINVGLTQVISKSLQVEPFYVLLGITVFVFGYMMFGGANSMVYTNTVQAVIMLIVALMMIFSGSNLFEGGIDAFASKLNAIDPYLTKTFNESSPLYRDFFEVVICQLIVGVAIVCQPHIMTKSLLLHSQLDDNENAVYYGKLAIRQDNEDTLMYVNNLVAIYLRTHQIKEAAELLENYRSIYEKTQNDHQKITYASYHLRVLTELNQLKKAENIAIYFLQKYETEIFEYRWHHFFTSYFTILLLLENYSTMLFLEKKFQLSKMEAKAGFVPNISWYILLSQYMENRISEEELHQSLNSSLDSLNPSTSQRTIIKNTAEKMVKVLPKLKPLFKSYI